MILSVRERHIHMKMKPQDYGVKVTLLIFH